MNAEDMQDMLEAVAADILALKLCVEQMLADKFIEQPNAQESLAAFARKLHTTREMDAPPDDANPSVNRIYDAFGLRVDDLLAGAEERILVQRNSTDHRGPPPRR